MSRVSEILQAAGARIVKVAGRLTKHDSSVAVGMSKILAENVESTAGSDAVAASAVARAETGAQAGASALASRSNHLIEELASQLHEVWRSPRLLEDGTYEPRPKQVRNDPAWVLAHGTDQVDIANTAYRDLPLDYKLENQESAKVAMPLVIGEVTSGRDPGRSDFIEDASRRVHDAWLDRNREWAPPEQDLAYSELSEPEKEKDRVVVRAAVKLVRDQPSE